MRGFAIAFVLMLAATPPVFAQSSVFAPAPFKDKAAAKQRTEEKMTAKKWVACRKQARTQKVKLIHRDKFMMECTAKGASNG